MDKQAYDVSKHSALNMSTELLTDWLALLLEENKHRIDNSSVEEGYFKTGVLAEFVFKFCKHFSQPAEVRYLALELLDRFFVKHIHDLYKHVSSSGSVAERSKQWEDVIVRIKSQLSLRALSCCQLASKLVSSYTIISSGKVWTMMKEFGHKFAFKAVLESEMRILKTLEYRIPSATPLLYVETLLAVLDVRDTTVEVSLYHPACCALLDLFYMRRSEHYSRYMQVIQSKRTPQPNERIRQEKAMVSNDYLLLAAAIITASLYIVSNENLSCQVATRLSDVSMKATDDILDFAAVIIELLQKQ